MARISGEIIQELLRILAPLMWDKQQRQMYLVQALGTNSPILNDLEWDGSTNVFITQMVRKLVDFGNINSGEPALCALLEVVCRNVGSYTQQEVNTLLQRIRHELKQPFSYPHVQVLGNGKNLEKLINQLTNLLQIKLFKIHRTVSNNSELKVYDNIEAWHHFRKENLYNTQRVMLEHFHLFEWFPLKPGKFHTDEARWYRELAEKSFKIKGENEKIYFDPYGKASMVEGGVGAVRLLPIQINGESHYFMTASSSGVCHEGFPVLIPLHYYGSLKQVINSCGAVPVTLKGEMRYVPNNIITFFSNDREIPLLYLHVDEVQIMSKPRHTITNYQVSVVISFCGELEGKKNNYVSYASFNPSDESSLEQSCKWLEQFYIRQYKGTIITDFDQVHPRFPKAIFGLPNLLGGTLDKNRIRDFIRANNLSVKNAETFFTIYDNINCGNINC